MVSQLSRFLNSGNGLEKTLRLIQSLSQIAAAFTVGSSAVRFTTAKAQLALTRRFFRFFGFIGSFQQVKDGMGTVAGILDLAKYTCFGLYFILEDLTILHAMGVYLVPWEPRVMQEANTFWFCALAFSIAGAVWALLSSSPAKPVSEIKSSESEKRKLEPKPGHQDKKLTTHAKTNYVGSSKLVRQIIAESCDVILPVTLLGWYPTGDLTVGLTMVLDSRGIEPRTTPMLREYYTTKPQALAHIGCVAFWLHRPVCNGGIGLPQVLEDLEDGLQIWRRSAEKQTSILPAARIDRSGSSLEVAAHR
ncbi:hypothetical protein N7539_005981, partial [Penicillium diatomitis]